MASVSRRDFIAGLGAGAVLSQGADAAFVSRTLGISVTSPPLNVLIPADRMTDWTQPGLTSRGGIPNRTTIFTTLSPLGNGQDDNVQITNALATCPDNQVVQLTAGVFRINGGDPWASVVFNRSNVTLRGAGPGQGLAVGNSGNFVVDPAATQLYLYNFSQAHNPAIVLSTIDAFQNIIIVNLTADAPLNTNVITLASNPFTVGQLLLLDQDTTNHPDVYWGDCFQPENPSGQTRDQEMRQGRSLSQVIEVVAVNGNTITTSAPMHCTFSPTYAAQVMAFNPGTTITGVGIEDLYIYGGNSGHISMTNCAHCWVKHVDCHWINGNALRITASHRIEVRDSFFHETGNPNPDGSYMIDFTFGTSDCLFENNISWYANKNIVMRNSGGGNVIAYNYFDDAFGANYPNLPETALNCEHMTTTHMELCEGNYAPNYSGGDFWGNNIDIMVFRNQLSAIRAAHPPLNTFVNGGTPYCDIGNPRFACGVHAHDWRHNFVGNILGKEGQQLVVVNTPTYQAAQTSWSYEAVNAWPIDGQVPMWFIGAQQDTNCLNQGWNFVPTTVQTILRQGNWDWYTQKQRWHGIGGSGPTDASTPQPIPSSLYLTARPAFFGSNPWPWVDPASGTTYLLPAKARFDSGKYNDV